MEKWKISKIEFLADQINPKLRLAYWEGHRDFAYDLVNFVKPKRIAELGSQYGCSLFAFCQSVLENHLDTEIHAVDYWRGDIGAQDSGEEVLKLVQQTISRYFSSVNINLYPMGFKEALEMFDDESIQILHIDGGHTFEEVDSDFQSWLPKLDTNGIILFHDVYSTIDQGSCDHWEYVKKSYKNWFEFRHSCGLGILFPKGDLWYQKIKQTDFSQCCQELYYYRALYEYTNIRYQELCGHYKERYDAICTQSKMIEERDQEIQALTRLVEEKDAAVKAVEQLVKEKDVAVRATEQLVKEKDDAVHAMSVENARWKQIGRNLKIRFK